MFKMSSNDIAISTEKDTSLQESIIKRPFAKRLQWTEQAMVDAMQAIQDGSTLSRAAREHGVPKTSLHNRIGKVSHGVKPGPKCYLSTEEETQLAEFIIETAPVGCGQTRAKIMDKAEKVQRKKTLWKERISHGWCNRFMQRHSYLSVRKRDAAANIRMDAVTSKAIKHYFDLLERTLKDNNLQDSPAQIYNMDESL